MVQFDTEPMVANVGINPKTEERPHLTFWFQKKDGTYFCCQENEAWNIVNGRIRMRDEVEGGIKRVRHKYIGASTSQIYFKASQEAKQIFNTQGLEAARQHLLKAEEEERLSADPSIIPKNMDYFGTPDAIRELRH